jgi:predicted acylesterase/phospholipase RssA
MTAKCETRPANGGQKPLALALQGGGAHGAFAWGVLDRLLEDGRLAVEGVSAATAGAMNAEALVHGLMQGGPEGARTALREFSHDIAGAAEIVTQLIEDGKIARGEMKQMPIDSIRFRRNHDCARRVEHAQREFLCFLHDKGRAQANAWLAVNYDTIGQRPSVDIHHEFL